MLEPLYNNRVDMPILSKEEYLQNSKINYKLYLKLIDISNFDSAADTNFRYIYKRYLIQLQEGILRDLNISKATFYKQLNQLIKWDLVELETHYSDIVYRIRVKDQEKYFIKLSYLERLKLLNLNSRQIKQYLVLKYSEKEIWNKRYSDIELVYISSKIGGSLKNTTPIKKNMEVLKEYSLIEYLNSYELKYKKNKKGMVSRIKVLKYHYRTTSEKQLKEEYQQFELVEEF